MSLIVVGSVALDTIETPHGKVSDALGGSAVHFALAASLLARVRLVGQIGRDLPEKALDPLRQRGVDLRGLQRKGGKTFRWSGRYSSDMNRRETVSVELNVFGQYAPEIPPAFRRSRFVFLANGSPEHQMQVLDQMRACRGGFAVVDTMDHWIHSSPQVLAALFKRVQAVVVNDSEARLLSGEAPLLRAAEKVLRMGPKYVIVKKGEHGAVMVSADGTFVIPAFPTAEVRDPTGAGDTFAGGMMGYLARRGQVTRAALRRGIAYGTVMASFNVEDFGVSGVAALTLPKVEARLRQFRKMLKF
jgi:sugar/nucleoside kinase (ribokinase family)